MKKMMLLLTFMMTMSAAFAQKTRQMMTVEKTDGTKIEYKVYEVQRVAFSQYVYPELNNQMDYNDKVEDIKAVHQSENPMYDDGNTYDMWLYTGDPQTSDYKINVSVSKSLLGKDIDISKNEVGCGVFHNGVNYSKGTLKMKFDKFGKNVTISLDVFDGSNELRAEYSGAFQKIYPDNNSLTLAVPDEIKKFAAILYSGYIVNPASAGEATSFAMSDVVTPSAPSDFLNGTCAVWLSVSASKLYNGAIDIVDDANSYTLRYIDYATRTVYDKFTSGTIYTAKDYTGKTYIGINATLEDGRQLRVERLGTFEETQSLDEIIPSAVSENEYKYYDADGNVSLTRKLGTSYLENYKGTLTFYLIPEGDTKYSSDKVQIKVDESLVNAGEIDLANIGETAVFDVKYNAGGIQLQSYAAGHGYGNIPNTGTMTITKNDSGVYGIKLDITNSYHNNYTQNGGDNTRLVLEYNGTLEDY